MNHAILEQTTEQLKNLLNSKLVEKFARQSSLLQRSTSKLNPLSLLIVLVVEMTAAGTHSLGIMCDLLHTYGSLKMTAQALSKRLGLSCTVRFLRLCYAEMLQAKFRIPTKELYNSGIISCFPNIYIEDSSTCDLHEAVAGAFKGNGGSGARAGYKMHLIWNAKNANIHRLDITPRSHADSSQMRNVLKGLRKGDLVLRDLGYFSVPCFRDIADKGAYFLSRLKQGVNVYTEDGKLIQNLPKYIDKAMGNSTSGEFNVTIGAKVRIKVRLVAFRMSEEALNERMRKVNKTARKSGYQVTKQAKEFNRFNIFITNIPGELLSADKLFTLYKFRWQIELVFKCFKSNFHINIIRGKSANRVECYILAKLIAILIICMVFSQIEAIAYEKYQRETSLHKFACWAMAHKYLLILFAPEKQDHRIRELQPLDILTIAKQKRSRKTTHEQLGANVGYSDLYQSSDS